MGFFSGKDELPKRVKFNTELARRIVPDKLVARGLFTTREEAGRALELVISMAEKRPD